MASPSTTLREAGTSPPARRPTRRRLSLSHLLIGFVVVLAFILNLVALQDRSAIALVAVADRPLAQGSVLSAEDIRFVEVDADFEGLPFLVSESAISQLEGWVVDRPIATGELLETSALVEPGAPSGLRSMSLPIAPEHAAGGTISAGDRVDVISVDDGVAQFVVTGVEVIGVSDPDAGSFGAVGDYHIVLAVDADQALWLAQAIDSGSLELIRSTGAPAITTGSADGS